MAQNATEALGCIKVTARSVTPLIKAEGMCVAEYEGQKNRKNFVVKKLIQGDTLIMELHSTDASLDTADLGTSGGNIQIGDAIINAKGNTRFKVNDNLYGRMRFESGRIIFNFYSNDTLTTPAKPVSNVTVSSIDYNSKKYVFIGKADIEVYTDKQCTDFAMDNGSASLGSFKEETLLGLNIDTEKLEAYNGATSYSISQGIELKANYCIDIECKEGDYGCEVYKVNKFEAGQKATLLKEIGRPAAVGSDYSYVADKDCFIFIRSTDPDGEHGVGDDGYSITYGLTFKKLYVKFNKDIDIDSAYIWGENMSIFCSNILANPSDTHSCRLYGDFACDELGEHKQGDVVEFTTQEHTTLSSDYPVIFNLEDAMITV